MSTLSIAKTERASPVQSVVAEPELETTAKVAVVRVADQIVSLLEEVGVDMVFGLPGGAIAPLFDAMLDSKRIRVINFRHETSAVFAAAAYARATDKLGVVLVTSGPGVTNAITGLASAYLDGLPVLLIAGEIARPNIGRGALQEGSRYFLDVVGMAERITKYASEIPSADTAAAQMRKAISTALSGRKGPVFLTVPVDIAASRVRSPRVTAKVESEFEIEGPVLDAAVQRLWQARRPMILAGSGVRWGDGPNQLRRLAEQIQCPVATTPKAKGVFPENHPLSLGVFGYGGHPSTSAYLEANPDVILAVGTGLGEESTNGWSPLLAKGALIQVEIDGGQIGRNYSVDLGIVGPASAVLSKLRAQLPVAQVRREFGVVRHSDAALAIGGRKLKPQRALWELQQVLPKNSIFTCDIGEHLMFAVHYLEVTRPDGFYLFSGLASMGSGNGAALGVKLAHPDRCVVAICGDGTISMSGVEQLSTAAHHGLSILFVVLNDGRYGMVEKGHQAIYGRSPGFSIPCLNIPALAEGLGALSVTAKKDADILAVDFPRLLSCGRPVVLNVEIDPDERLAKSGRASSIKKYAN